MKPTSWLIDASIYFFRYYFSPRPEHRSKSGREVSSALAFVSWLLRLLEQEQPEELALCFDESLGTGFRHGLDSTYKAQRALPDEALIYELLAVKHFAEHAGLACFASSVFEADDLIASLAKGAHSRQRSPVIVSRDKDLGQLLTAQSGALLWDYGFGDPLHRDEFTARYGVEPESWALYLALVGDPIDNIQGVTGVGPKSAAIMLRAYPDWAELQAHVHALETLELRCAKRLAQAISAQQARVSLNLQLTTLRYDALPSADSLRRGVADIEALQALLHEWRAPATLIHRTEQVLMHENSCR